MEERQENLLEFDDTFRFKDLPDTTTPHNATNMNKPLINTSYLKNKLSKNVLVKIESKNLFNKDTIVNKKLLNPNGNEIEIGDSFYSDYIEVEPNVSYVLSGGMELPATRAIVFYDEDKQFVKGEAAFNKAYKTDENTKYVRISNHLMNLNTLQFELGNVATEYVDYVDTKGLTGYFKIDFR